MQNDYKEHSQSHQFWTDKSIQQLGYSINLFTSIGLAFLWYFIEQLNDIKVVLSRCNIYVYSISLILSTISVLLGLLGVMARLYNLRIIRHIKLIRKMYAKDIEKKYTTEENEKPVSLPTERLTSKALGFSVLFGCLQTIKNYSKIIIDTEDYKSDSKLFDKFKKLREKKLDLGNFTWVVHKRQILVLFLTVIFYVISVLYFAVSSRL